MHDFHDILDKQVFKCQKGYSRFASETATEGALLKKAVLKHFAVFDLETCNFIKDTHRERAPSYKTPALTKSTNMGI